jgi:hypothetical protein
MRKSYFCYCEPASVGVAISSDLVRTFSLSLHFGSELRNKHLRSDENEKVLTSFTDQVCLTGSHILCHPRPVRSKRNRIGDPDTKSVSSFFVSQH